MPSKATISTIVDDLYAGTLEHAAWNRALIAMADLVSGTGTLLFGFDPVARRVLRDEIHRFDPVAVAQYRQTWFAKDVRYEPCSRASVGEPMYEAKLLPLGQFKKTEFYNDYLIPVDSPSCLVTWLHKEANKLTALSVQAGRHREPFDERDAQRLEPLIPHVRRALEIKDRLEVAHIRADSLARTLDNLSFGVIVLDQAGRILEASAVAQDLMRSDSGIRRNPDGTVWLRDSAGVDLYRWILAGTPPPHTDGLLRVMRPPARPVSVMVTPLPVKTTAWITGDPRWMLLLFDPDRNLVTSTELIARDLGISEREAQIAARLVAGYELKQIAERLRISVHTARTHLKTIYSKTGIRSQAELVRRIATGPAVLRTTAP